MLEGTQALYLSQRPSGELRISLPHLCSSVSLFVSPFSCTVFVYSNHIHCVSWQCLQILLTLNVMQQEIIHKSASVHWKPVVVLSPRNHPWTDQQSINLCSGGSRFCQMGKMEHGSLALQWPGKVMDKIQQKDVKRELRRKSQMTPHKASSLSECYDLVPLWIEFIWIFSSDFISLTLA